MIEEPIEIQTADGVSGGFLYHPENGSRRPGVIHFTDIGGIRPAQQDMARRLAGQGYVVLLPNIFYRTRRPPMFDFKMNMADERSKKRFAELTEPMTPEAVERDASLYIDFLAKQPSVRDGKIAVVGYCFSGAVAMRAAAARPDKVAAAASFHGGRLFTDAPTSPHLLLPRIQARLYFVHAIKDNSMPEEAIAGLDRSLKVWGGRYESEVYDGAYHGWTTPDSPVYNQGQAERAFGKLTELLAQTLHHTTSSPAPPS